MRKKEQILLASFYTIGFIIFLLDFKTTAEGASQAITLCVKTVIPALFPFMVLSILLNSHYAGIRMKAFKPINKACKIPEGCESIFILGLLGGYPVGAQGIYQAWRDKQISTNQAHRLLGFCNNAGPAFIFGMAISCIENPLMIWMLWGIHILSAISTGVLLPYTLITDRTTVSPSPLNFTSALEKAIKTMAMVCGWIIIFRIIIIFIKKWCSAVVPPIIISILAGVLELANGCTGLYAVQSQGLRFILLSAFLAFGGLCVAAQTASATKELGSGLYFPGKVIQCCISIVFSYFAQRIILPQNMQYHLSGLLVSIFVLTPALVLCLLNKKKIVAFIYSMMYNNRKSTGKEHAYAVSEKADSGLRTLCTRNKI